MLALAFYWLLGVDSGSSGAAWKAEYLEARASDAFYKKRFAEAEKLFRTVLEADATNEPALVHLAVIHRDRKEFVQASDLLQRAANAHPRSFAVFHELGALRLRLQQPAAAADAFVRATEINPNAVDAWVNLGDAYRINKRIDDARAAYERAIKVDANSAWAHRQRGYLAFDTAEYEQAVTHLTAAAKDFQKEAPLFLTRGHANAALQRHQEALADYREAAQLDPKMAVAHMFAGLSLMALHREEEAEKAFLTTLEQQPNDAPTLVHLGNLLRQQKKIDEAIRRYERAVKAQPAYTWAHAQLGFILVEKHDFQRAEKTLQRALELDPENDDVELTLGDLAIRRRDMDEAEQRYRRILLRTPAHEQASQKLASLALAEGHLDQARALCLRVVATSPKNMPAWVTLGDTERAAHHLDDALIAYGRAIAIAPTSTWARKQFGFALFEAKRDQEAVVQLERALQDGEDFETLLTLGHLARRRHDTTEAKAWYKRASLSAPSLGRAHMFAADIEREVGNVELAIEGLELAVQLEPGLFDAWVLLGDAASLARQRTARRAELARGQARAGNEASSLPIDATPASAPALDPTHALLTRFNELAERAYEKAIALNDEVSKAAAAKNKIDLRKLGLDAAREGTDAKVPEASEAQKPRSVALQRSPYNVAWPKRQLGFLRFYANDPEAAKPLLHAARGGFLDDPEIPLVLGHIARQEMNPDLALTLYEDAASLTDTDPKPAIFSAVVLRDLGRRDDALSRLKHVLDAHPDSAWANYEAALSYLDLKKKDEALKAVQRSLELDDQQREAWLLAGKLQHQRRKLDEAIAAYRRALRLSANYAPAEVGLASALFDRGTQRALFEAAAVIERALVDLPDDAFANVVAGRAFAALTVMQRNGEEVNVEGMTRGFDVGLTLEAISVRHLQLALQKTPDDDALRLSVGTTLVELARPDLAQVTMHPLLERSNQRCPSDEFSITYRLMDDGVPAEWKELNSAEKAELDSEDVAALAQITAGTLADQAGNAPLARIHFACALAIQPGRTEAHLRLGLAYENDGFLRLAEDHYATAAILDPKSLAARSGLDRLRKEGGIAVVDGLRLSGEVGFRSDALGPEALYRNLRALDQRGAFSAVALTVPRTLFGQATASIRHSTWRSLPRFDISYRLFREEGGFLNDQQRLESRVGHNPELKVAGTVPLRARFGEWTYAFGESVVYADSASRQELRAFTSASSRFNWFRVLNVDATLGYEVGAYLPRTVDLTQPITNFLSHMFVASARVEPWLAALNLRASLDYRLEAVWLVPSSQKIWNNVATLNVGTRIRSVEFDQLVRLSLSGYDFRLNRASSSFGYTLKTRGAYFYRNRFTAGASVSFAGVAAERSLDQVAVGADAAYIWLWPVIPGSSHSGFRFYAAYDLRIAYQRSRLDHLFTAGVSFAR